jgi:hypothetical protein
MKQNTIVIMGLIAFSFGLLIGHLTQNIYVLLFQPVAFMIGCIIGAIIEH